MDGFRCATWINNRQMAPLCHEYSASDAESGDAPGATATLGVGALLPEG